MRPVCLCLPSETWYPSKVAPGSCTNMCGANPCSTSCGGRLGQRLLADLHGQVHAHDIPGLPAQQERIIHAIRTADGLNEAVRQRFVEVVQCARERQCLCHGDLHPGNVMMTAEGPVILDWINATRGDRLPTLPERSS